MKEIKNKNRVKLIKAITGTMFFFADEEPTWSTCVSGIIRYGRGGCRSLSNIMVDTKRTNNEAIITNLKPMPPISLVFGNVPIGMVILR